MTGNAKTILVIDDSLSIRVYVKQLLEQSGFAVEVVASGVAALQKLRKERFDLIIIDYHMPDMNGDRVTTTIRAKPDGKDVPILIMTGDTDDDVKIKFRRLGANGWLPKPLEDNRVLAAVNYYIS